jgi:hypothetical protein
MCHIQRDTRQKNQRWRVINDGWVLLLGAYMVAECVSVDVVRDVTHMEAVARVALCAAPALVGRVFIAANVIAAVHEVVAHVAHPFVAGAEGVVGVGPHLQVQERVVAAADHAVRQGRWPLLQAN